MEIVKIVENEVLFADLGEKKLYRIVERDENNVLENTSESES